MHSTAPLNFLSLPSFAKFLLEHHLRDVVKEQLRLLRQLDLPILKFFSSLNEEQLVAVSEKSIAELLTFLINNKASEQIEVARRRWIDNQLPNLERDQVLAEDITGVSYVRKRTLISFIPNYTSDAQLIIALVQEINEYIFASETVFAETYINIMSDRLHEREEQLQRNEELYKQAQALSHIGNWTWLIKEDKVLWSDELYRIYGLEPHSQTITFERFASFIHPDDKEELFNAIQHCITAQEPYELHHRIIRADGTVRYINAKGRLQTDDEGQPSQMVGTGQDVTERMKIEEEVRESQRFIQKIADATPAIIASYNVNTGRYKFVSQGLKKMLGHDPQLPLDQGIQFFVDIIHPDDLAPIMERNSAALARANSGQPITDNGEPVVEFEYRMRHANGEYRWFHSFGTIFDRNESGQVEHVLNISIDTSERKDMETALSQKNLQLEQSNANLEEFAYVASHDLKEPLRKISIFGDRFLSTQQDLGNEGQFYLEKIIDSSRRMQSLINDLLSLSLISGNKAFVQHSLQTVLDEVLRMLEFKIEEKQAIIRSGQLPEARIIPTQFRQLFQNLLTNSLKFTRANTRPEINISYQWLRPAEVEQYKLPRSKTYLEVTFMDNGIGFDNMFAGKIFAIFQRLHHKDYEGTGIGLAICKKIVENHGGIIFATGEPGKGAIFTFIIPV